MGLWKTKFEHHSFPAHFLASNSHVDKGAVMKKVSFKDDKGDVPGWVLITLMTAGLVVVIWAFAAPALQGVFDEAMDRVVSF